MIKKVKDELGNRMKEQYENITRYSLPRRTYTIIRLDGVAFHTFTKQFVRPFDDTFITALNNAVIEMSKKIQGFQFAYLQSDEISILLTDFSQKNTEAWFGGNIQKICSVSASMLTFEFNKQLELLGVKTKWAAYFDARAFVIPDKIEVSNYFYWRWKDCERNAINAVAHNILGHSKCQNKSTKVLQELLFQEKGINFSTLKEEYKNGRLVTKIVDGHSVVLDEPGFCMKTLYSTKAIPMFNLRLEENRNKIMELIPVHGY